MLSIWKNHFLTFKLSHLYSVQILSLDKFQILSFSNYASHSRISNKAENFENRIFFWISFHSLYSYHQFRNEVSNLSPASAHLFPFCRLLLLVLLVVGPGAERLVRAVPPDVQSGDPPHRGRGGDERLNEVASA